MGKTDAEGSAESGAEEGTYTVHILKVPESYQAETGEIGKAAEYLCACSEAFAAAVKEHVAQAEIP